MDYDNWLVNQEHNYRGWNNEHKCQCCEKPIDKRGYCSYDCFRADIL